MQIRVSRLKYVYAYIVPAYVAQLYAYAYFKCVYARLNPNPKTTRTKAE